MRELMDYRITLEGLNANYGDADLIRISDFVKKNNIDRRTVEKMIATLRIPVVHNHYMNKHALARALSKAE